MVKVTEEIADFIYRKHQEGMKLDKVVEHLKKEFNIEFSYATVSKYSCKSFKEVKEKQREYQREYYSRPEVKEKQREYQREYRSRPEVKERQRKYQREYKTFRNLEFIIINIFDSEEFTEQELRTKLWQVTGKLFEFKAIRKAISSLEENLERNSPIIYDDNDGKYKLNKESPYWRICNGYVNIN